MRIDFDVFMAAVRSIVANPEAPMPQTGDMALDRALAAFATRRVQNTMLPYWMLSRAEPEGRIVGR